MHSIHSKGFAHNRSTGRSSSWVFQHYFTFRQLSWWKNLRCYWPKMDYRVGCHCFPNWCCYNGLCSFFPGTDDWQTVGWSWDRLWCHDCTSIHRRNIPCCCTRISFINIGILLGYISNYVSSGLSYHINWRIMLGVGILPSVFIGIALFVIPESPRWLVMQKRVDKARSVLMKLNESDEDVEQRLAEIEKAASFTAAEGYEEKAVWRELLSPSPAVRRMMITGFGIQCFQQITGIDATVYYSPTIFKDAGITSDSKLLAATVAVGFTKTLFILVAIFLIDRVGRKPLLFVSTIGMTTCLFGLGLALSLLRHELVSTKVGIGVAILAVCGNVAFFSVGIGPICWVLSSEIFPLRLRAQASALGAVGSRVSSGLIAMSFLSVCRILSVGGTFFLFSVISATSVVFVYNCVPETKGKTLEQIEMLFQDGIEWQRCEVELGDVEHLVQKN